MEKKETHCQYKNCNVPSVIVYLDNGLCERHWVKIAEMEHEKVMKILKINIKEY